MAKTSLKQESHKRSRSTEPSAHKIHNGSCWQDATGVATRSRRSARVPTVCRPRISSQSSRAACWRSATCRRCQLGSDLGPGHIHAEGGAAARGRQGATLQRLAHEKFVDPALGRLIDALAP